MLRLVGAGLDRSENEVSFVLVSVAALSFVSSRRRFVGGGLISLLICRDRE